MSYTKLEGLVASIYRAFPELNESDAELPGTEAVDRLAELWPEIRSAYISTPSPVFIWRNGEFFGINSTVRGAHIGLLEHLLDHELLAGAAKKDAETILEHIRKFSEDASDGFAGITDIYKHVELRWKMPTYVMSASIKP